MDKLKRLSNETEEAYLWRVGQMVDSGQVPHWKEINETINREFGIDEDSFRDESSFRKRYQAAKKFYENVFTKTAPSTQLSQVREMLGEQYIVKREIQAENVKLNRVKRDFIRSIAVAEEIKEFFLENGLDVEVPDYCYEPIQIDNNNKTMVVVLSDFHIGYVINNCRGNYFNWEIANERIDNLLEACHKYIALYGIKQVNVYNLGDTIEGTYMRKNQSQYCEFLQGEQISRATLLIHRILVSLCKDCNVLYDGVAGNHDRMNGDKTQNFDGDNANSVITPMLMSIVEASENKRITIVDRDYRDSEIVTNINGVRCKLVHGDQSTRTDKIKNEISMDNQFYDLYVEGHWHNHKVQSENRGRYIVTNGCLSGFNSYSTAFGCATEASQTIIIIADGEVELIKDVQLSKCIME